MYDIIERWLNVFARSVYKYVIIESGFVSQLLAHIIIKYRSKMAAGFRLVEVSILSGWSILLRECLRLVVIKEHPI